MTNKTNEPQKILKLATRMMSVGLIGLSGMSCQLWKDSTPVERQNPGNTISHGDTPNLKKEETSKDQPIKPGDPARNTKESSTPGI